MSNLDIDGLSWTNPIL